MLTAALLSAGARGESAKVPSVFGPGEQSTYEVAYLGIIAGTVEVTVGSEMSKEAHRVWPIVVLAKSRPQLTFYPIRDKFVTYWDPRAHWSVHNELVLDENHKRTRQVVSLDQQGHVALITRQKEGGDEVKLSQPIAPDSLDMAAATFAVRNHPLSLGTQLEIPVFTGKKSFVLKIQVESKQLLHTPLGTVEAFRARVQTEFTGKLRSKHDIFAYFSADARSLLLRVEADLLLGTLTGELVDYKPGRQDDKVLSDP